MKVFQNVHSTKRYNINVKRTNAKKYNQQKKKRKNKKRNTTRAAYKKIFTEKYHYYN